LSEKHPQSILTIWDHPRFKNWVAVARVHAIWQRRLTLCLAPLGIKLPHYDVLANLVREPGMTQQRLADKLFVGRSNLSMLLPEMEKRGWITRQSDLGDKRVRRVHLTPEGERIARTALADHAQLLNTMMDALSQDECDSMGDLMRRIADRLKTTV
jgi:MarR family transcriptional regulator, organic hydroperoxide resistance regulator